MDSSLLLGLGTLGAAATLVYVSWNEGKKLNSQKETASINYTDGVDANLVDLWKNMNIGGASQPDQFTRSLEITQKNSERTKFSDLFKDTAKVQDSLTDSTVRAVQRGTGASIVTQGGSGGPVPVLPGPLTNIDPKRIKPLNKPSQSLQPVSSLDPKRAEAEARAQRDKTNRYRLNDKGKLVQG